MAIVSSLLFSILLFQSPAIEPGRTIEKVKVGEIERSFILRIPKSYRADKPTPLVIVYHGFTASAAIMEPYTRVGQHAESEGYILAIPDGTGKPQGWNAGFIDLTGAKSDDIGFTKEILSSLRAKLNIDRKRTYAWGHSNGAMMCNLIGAELSTEFAAFASVAGTAGVPTATGFSTVPNPKAPISVLLIHGQMDKTVAYEPSARALLKGLGAQETAKWWAEKNGCDMQPTVVKAPNGKYESKTFAKRKGQTVVTVISTYEGSHDIPGSYRGPSPEDASGLNAVSVIWEFFKEHPRP